ncbi:MAG: response regulator [Lachnospiraceae bacterium]|nr:response regulator [Lachnospiraceae bacterium]
MKNKQKSLASRIEIVVLLAVLLASGLVCVVSVVQAENAIRTSTRQRMLDIANCASGSVNGDVLKKLTKEDQDTAEYKRVYDSLAIFRDNIETEYIYGIRKEDDGRFTFTVDPALNDPAEFGAEVVKTDALIRASNGIASADEKPYTDEWGTFYSAYSPVFDSAGNVAGIIAVDFSKKWYEGQQAEQIGKTIILYLVILVFTLMVVGFICFLQINSIVEPMAQITKIAKRYQDGDYTGNLEVDRDDELGVLSRTLQSMATSLTEQIMIAEAADRAKGDFLASMSHEIRTPINAMLGNNEMIFRESEEADIRKYSENVKAAGAQLLGLVDEILAYSKNGEKQTGSKPQKAERKRERFTASDARILAVDDNSMNLQVFLNLVKRTGIIVDTALSGDEGLALAKETKYDVIVLDHMMPEKDGIETLAQLRADKACINASTPAICLTANAVPGARKIYMDAGFDDYLTKPVDTDELEVMLRKFIPDEKIEVYEVPEGSEEGMEKIPEELERLRTRSVDIDAGIKNNGSVDSYLSLLGMFYRSVDDNTGELNRLYSENDIKNYIIKVHGLKSLLRIIGATGLGEEAQALEDAGKNDDQNYIRANHDRFIDAFRRLCDDLSYLFTEEEDDGADRPEADTELINRAYDQIRKAADDMDCDRLETVFEEMKAYRIPEDEAELFGKLRAASERFEYATIIELLDGAK